MQKSQRKEVIMYLIFGVLTTVVSMASFWYFHEVLQIEELIANVFSWVLSVLFAFVTNRIWVFNERTKGILAFLKQMAAFFGGRVTTLLLEEGILLVFITRMQLPAMWVKLFAQGFVIVANFFISKLLVFRKDNKREGEE